MTESQRRFIERAKRRIAGLQPDVLAAILRAYTIIQASLSIAELTRLIRSGSTERLIADVFSPQLLDRAFQPLRDTLRDTAQDAYELAARELPPPPRTAARQIARGSPANRIDLLDPEIAAEIRTLVDDFVEPLKANVQQTVRQAVTAGIENGASATAIAETVRDVVPLPPQGEQAVRNFRDALESGDVAKVLDKELRDPRFDKTLKAVATQAATEKTGAKRTLTTALRARAKRPTKPATAPKALSSKQVDTMTKAYSRGLTAHHAAIEARTATFDAYKRSQLLAWQDAVKAGHVDAGSLRKQWLSVGDDRVRPTHRAMHGETVPIDSPYSSGQTTAGEGEYGCRCIDRFILA